MTSKDERSPDRTSRLEMDSALSSLRDLDIDVLRTLGGDEGRVAFQGLRRRMNVHQERLSRSLQRLEEEGFVSKGPRGYVLTEKGVAFTHRWFTPTASESTVILESFLPTDLSPAQVTSRLEGKWFSNLRWLGVKDDANGAILRWVTEETGVEVVLRVSWGKIVLETSATSREGLSEAFVAAQRLFASLSVSWAQDWNQPQYSASA